MDEEILGAGGADIRIGGQSRRPFQAKRVGRNHWTRGKRQIFLDTLAQTCNVTMASQAAGMGNKSPYVLRKSDPVFAALWQEALALGYERLETALLHHALIGVNALEVRVPSVDAMTAPADAQDGAPATDAAGPSPAPAAAERGRALPGSGLASDTLTPVQVQVALAMLNRRDAALRTRVAPRGLRQVTLAEAETALTRALETLAQQKIRSAEMPRTCVPSCPPHGDGGAR